MYDLPSQDNIEEVIVDASAVKGQTQPILVHSKGGAKSKNNKTTSCFDETTSCFIFCEFLQKI